MGTFTGGPPSGAARQPQPRIGLPWHSEAMGAARMGPVLADDLRGP